jgi:hypothetical protein
MDISDIISVSFLSGIFTNGIAYFIQRKHKIADATATKKNEIVVAESIANEVKLFEIFNTAFQKIGYDSVSYRNAANEMHTIRKNNRLYLKDKVYYLSEEIANYSLEVAADPLKIDKTQEQKFIHRFKDAFDK